MTVPVRFAAVARRLVRAASFAVVALVCLCGAVLAAVVWVLAMIFGAVVNALVTISRHPGSAALFFGLLAVLAVLLVMRASGVDLDAVTCAAASAGGTGGHLVGGR